MPTHAQSQNLVKYVRPVLVVQIVINVIRNRFPYTSEWIRCWFAVPLHADIQFSIQLDRRLAHFKPKDDGWKNQEIDAKHRPNHPSTRFDRYVQYMSSAGLSCTPCAHLTWCLIWQVCHMLAATLSWRPSGCVFPLEQTVPFIPDTRWESVRRTTT